VGRRVSAWLNPQVSAPLSRLSNVEGGLSAVQSGLSAVEARFYLIESDRFSLPPTFTERVARYVTVKWVRKDVTFLQFSYRPRLTLPTRYSRACASFLCPMALPLRRPILVGGLGLTVGAWVFSAIDPSLTHLADSAVWGIAALGSGFWLLKQRGQLALTFQSSVVLDRTAVDGALADVEARICQLETESQAANLEAAKAQTMRELVVQLRQQLAALRQELDRKELRLAVAGGKASGKTTVVELLRTQNLPATLPATINRSIAPANTTNTTDSAASEPPVEPASAAAPEPADPTQEVDTADLVLFVTTGDLRDSEFRAIEPLIQRDQRVVLLFNKQDQYLPDERPLILQQLRERMQGLLAADDIVAIAAQPAPVIVRRQQADGSIQEVLEQPQPDIALLQTRLKEIVSQEGSQLILNTVLRQAKVLNIVVQNELNQFRRTRALPIIEQYQWIAAAAAFANPVPSLDLIATASVTGQLVIDLGAIYQQKFSIDQAKTVMVQLAEQMVKLGLVEAATQAISPLLKSHALTYVAGGTLQGLSAAYLTHIAGLSLVEYFEEQSLQLHAQSEKPFQLDRLVQKIKAVLQDNQRSVFVQRLVKQGINRLLPPSTQAEVIVKSEVKSEADVKVQA
jgi:uncharacterized protein